MAGLLCLVFVSVLLISSLTLHSKDAQNSLQKTAASVLAINLNSSNKPPDDDGGKVLLELDVAIESFFRKIVKNFISSWFSNITQDETFVWNVKVEVAGALRKLALRLKDVRINCLTMLGIT